MVMGRLPGHDACGVNGNHCQGEKIMGVMNELVVKQMAAFTGVDFSKARFDGLAERGCHNAKTEVEIETGLNLIRLYAGVYEGGVPTNGIINVTKPWDVRLSWCLTGPLKQLVCGTWCVNVHFESIGEGEEFSLKGPEFKFGCEQDCYSVCIPGRSVKPDDCSTPYKVVATVQYKSMCGKPGAILGFVEFPMMQFYYSDY
jgi:hypothetical protein